MVLVLNLREETNMKKLLSLLLLVLFAVVAMAQERTVSITLKDGNTRWDYTGVAKDTLTETNQDTIDFVMEYRSAKAIEKIDLFFQADSLAGDDSIYVSLLGLKDLSGAATTLISSTGALIDGLDIVKELSLYQTFATDTTSEGIIKTLIPTDLSYRYYKLRMIQAANNSFDGGAEIDYVRMKLYQK